MEPETTEARPTQANHDAEAGPFVASDSPGVRQARPGRRRRDSIRLRLASLVVACVLPVWIAAGFLVYYNDQSKRAITEQRMLDTARALTLVVDRELATMQASLEALASSPSLASGNMATFQTQTEAVLRKYPGGDIILADATGQQIVNSFLPFGAPLPRRGVQNTEHSVYESGRPVITNLFGGAVTGRPLIGVDVPVFRDGRVVYDLAMTVPADHFNAVLAQQHLPPEWIGRIYDSNQVLISRSRFAEKFVGRSSRMAQQLRDHSEGTVESVTFEGVPTFNSFSRSAASGWTVSIGIPKAIMMAELRGRLWWTIAGTALLSLTGLLLALLMARRIASSIQSLVAPALALGRGEAVAIGHLDLVETSEVGESLLKASELIQQRAAEREHAEAARHETEQLRGMNAQLERSEVEARALAAELAAILDAVPAVTFIAHDPECKRMTSNRAGYDLLRLPPGANTSKSAPESELSSDFRMRDGRKLSADELPLQMAAATGREVRDCEYTIVFDDGSSRTLYGNAVPLLDERGGVRGAVGAFTDITGRKKTEEALRDNEQRLRLFVDYAPAGVAMFDREMRYMVVSQRWLTDHGLGGQGLTGCSHFDVLAGRIPERWKETIRRSLAGAVEKSEEDVFERTDGKVDWLRWELRPWHKAGGEIGGVILFSEVITGRKEAEAKIRGLEQQLRQSAKMEAVGRLAGGIAHDFNNLLMVIQSYTEMLQDALSPHNPLRNNTQEIMKAADRAANLTRQMLAFGRKQIISPVVLDLNALLEETAKMIRRLIGEDIEFRVEPAASLWAIEADPDQIVQILMNLCVNARDAMPRGGTLTVATGNITVGENGLDQHPYIMPGEYVSLLVTDTGVGISKELQERIFEPFFTTKGVGEGTGLGLSTVYGTVKQSGGYVWVDSEPGRGACFTIFLPRATKAIAPHMFAKPEAAPRGTETILVAEDEEALREAIGDYLRSLEYVVLTAGSGQEALSIAGRHEARIDLLVSDLVMPKMTGRELSQMLGSLRPDLKTIYMSGYTDDDVLRRGMQELGTSFLQKPFSLRTLGRKIRDVLGKAKL